MLKKQTKQKKCKYCDFNFFPRSTTQVVCSARCAIELNNIKKQKAFDAETKRRKQGIKKRGEWEEDAQKAVNLYVRLRDKLLPCISCGRYHTGQYHAGHYISRGANKTLSYNLLNINKQCAPCNKEKSGNPIPYRINLIKKIGLEKVELLEGAHEPNKYTIDDLKRIRKIFTKKAKRLKAK